MKVFEFAKEVGLETIALMDKIRSWQLPVKSHMATLTEEQIENIRLKIEEERGGPKKKTTKKVVKKKTKAGAKKKTVVKKVAVKKASSEVTKTAKTKKKSASKKKSTVIRRKASDIEAQLLKAQEEEMEAATQSNETSELNNSYDENQHKGTDGELENVELSAEAGQEGSSSKLTETTATPTTFKRRNIVGKMDLSRVRSSGPRSSSSSGGASPRSASGSGPVPSPSTKPSQQRTGPGRNIRTGFIGPAPMMPDDKNLDLIRKANEEKKKKAGAGKDQTVQSFTAADFRKREIIFQPKKKRVNTGITKKTQITQPKALKRIVKMQNSITVSELAQEMNIKVPQLTKKLMAEGVMATMNTPIDFDTVSLIVGEFGFEAQNVAITEEDLIAKAVFGDVEAEPVTRPPVVTVMGHVDHGKTTLLDAIRNADVVSGEAGGITQHIGAYNVTLKSGLTTTFIDTPGHAAFTAMRSRGANVTDIVVIVVAADDGMMPQTEEAISHAKAAGVPIIVAVNKMDKQGANPDRIKQQLADKELVPEDWGGETIFVPVSALKKEGIEELLENIHLVSEVLDLKANPKRSATGVIIESKMEKGKGNVATVLVQDGTIRIGEAFVAGTVTGRIRRMTNDKGELVKEAGPGTPIEITGLEDSPGAGDRFDICESDEKARQIANLRKKMKEQQDVPNSKMSLDAIFSKVKSGDLKELNVVLKTDVVGSLEAIKGLLDKLGTDEVKVKVVYSGVGGISENDVLLASTVNGLIIGFNVRPDTVAQRVAKEKSVDIKSYSIIYNLADDIKAAMGGLLDPDVVEETLGSVEVREVFSVPKIGTIAGCFVTDGKVTRNSMVRLLREGRIVYSGKISSLKRFKDDAKEVQTGYECGVGIENYNDIKVGDIIEAYHTKEIVRSLE